MGQLWVSAVLCNATLLRRIAFETAGGQISGRLLANERSLVRSRLWAKAADMVNDPAPVAKSALWMRCMPLKMSCNIRSLTGLSHARTGGVFAS